MIYLGNLMEDKDELYIVWSDWVFLLIYCPFFIISFTCIVITDSTLICTLPYILANDGMQRTNNLINNVISNLLASKGYLETRDQCPCTILCTKPHCIGDKVYVHTIRLGVRVQINLNLREVAHGLWWQAK